MSLVLFGRVVRIARQTPAPYVPPITGFRDVAFAWDAVDDATRYILVVSTDDFDTYDAYDADDALTYTVSLMSGTYQSKVEARSGTEPPYTLISTTDPQEFTV